MMAGLNERESAPRRRGASLLLASLDPRDEGFAGLGDDRFRDIDWSWLLERARRHKVLALFAARMERHGYLQRLAPGDAAKLEEAREEARTRAESARRTLRMVSEICRELDAPFFVVKGSFLAEQVYGDAELRTFSDVDVVIHKEHMYEVDRALRERGYYFLNPDFIHKEGARRLRRDAPAGEVPGSDAAARRMMMELHRHWVFVLKQGDPRLQVELHWHIADPGQMKVGPAEVWEATTERTLAGQTVRTLRPEAALLHCAVHAMEHTPEGFRLLHLIDVLWIAERLGPELDMGLVRTLAHAWGVERHLSCALSTAEAVFPFSPPATLRAWPGRSRWSRACLHMAGMNEWLVGQSMPDSGPRRFATQVRAETFWELALLQPPRHALSRVRQAVSARLKNGNDGQS